MRTLRTFLIALPIALILSWQTAPAFWHGIAPSNIGVQASRAKNFTNSVGFVDQSGTSGSAAAAAATNMGMSVTRTYMPYTGDGGGNYAYLAANTNMRFDFLWFGTNCTTTAPSLLASSLALEDTFVATYPGKLLVNEGLNETNNFPYCYFNTATTNGATSTSSAVLHFASTIPEIETVSNYSFDISGTGTVGTGAGITVTDATQTIDPGSNYVACSNCSGFSLSITINSPNEVLVSFVATNTGAVSAVNDTLGLSWSQRATSGGGQPEAEWTALGPTGGTYPQTDTVSFTAPAGYITAGIIGIVGANTSSPFDGSAVVHAGDPVTISTSHANTMIVAGFRMASTSTPTAGSGWTAQPGGSLFYSINEYQGFSSTQSGLSVTLGTGAGDAQDGIADAIVLNSPPRLPAISANTTIISATGTTVTLSANAINGGVQSGDTIQFTAPGVTGPSAAPLPELLASVAESLLWQAAIYNATYADANLAGVKVANYTSYFGTTTPQPPAIAGTGDYNNIHFYPGNPGGVQPTTYVGSSMPTYLTPSAQPIPNVPTVITEGGYCTGTGTTGLVDQTTQARLEMNLYFDMWLAGVPYTTLYVLFDFNTGDNSCFDNYGFYESDGTTIKANGTAVKNTYTILNDTAGNALTFTPGKFNYSISGLPASGAGGGNSLLLQKSNGTWEIVVWQEPVIWNDTTHAQVTPSTSSITVTLPITATTVNVYDPIISATPTTTSGVSSVSASLTSDPLIIEVVP